MRADTPRPKASLLAVTDSIYICASVVPGCLSMGSVGADSFWYKGCVIISEREKKKEKQLKGYSASQHKLSWFCPQVCRKQIVIIKRGITGLLTGCSDISAPKLLYEVSMRAKRDVNKNICFKQKHHAWNFTSWSVPARRQLSGDHQLRAHASVGEVHHISSYAEV